MAKNWLQLIFRQKATQLLKQIASIQKRIIQKTVLTQPVRKRVALAYQNLEKYSRRYWSSVYILRNKQILLVYLCYLSCD